MQRSLENYFLNVIRGKKRGFIASILRLILRLLSWPFQWFVGIRNWAFDHGWLRRYYPPVPVVISIGNIVVGGTGKTPVTLMLANEFYDKFPLAILSRGYRSQAEKLPTPVVLSKGEGPIQTASFCGDEPYLLAQNLPNAFVFVGKDRQKASNMAAREGVQLILLDDGMQHRRLARDLEIVVMDARDPFGQGYHLPRGLLREGKRSLARADLIVLNNVLPDEDIFTTMKAQLACYSQAPIVGTRMEVAQILDFEGSPLSIAGVKVGIFCGIARPDYFEQTVAEQGAEIVATTFASDHMSFKPEALAQFAETCKSRGAEFLLCTEKDRVKITDVSYLALPIACLKMRLTIIEGEAEWKSFVEKAKADIMLHSA